MSLSQPKFWLTPLGLSFMLATLFCASLSHAQTKAAMETSIEDARKALQLKETNLKASEQLSHRLESDISSLATERAKLKKRLIETADLVKKSEAQLTASETRLAGLDADEKQLRLTLAAQHTQISRLFSTLQRMGRNPPPVIITRREDALKMVRSAMLIARAFPGLRQDAEKLAKKLSSLVQVMTQIRAESKRLAEETNRLKATRLQLAGLVEKRQQSITEHQSELQKVRQAAAQMSTSVDNLNELITKLTNETAKLEKVREHEAEAKKQIAAAEEKAKSQPPASATSKPATPEATDSGQNAEKRNVIAALPPDKATEAAPKPDVTKPNPAVVLAPGGRSILPGNNSRMKPAIAFALAKGKLPLPANGRRVLSYGDKTQYGGDSKGLVLETRHNAQVTSPCDGWIVYAGEFRSYGQLLIINAGGGYHVLLAGMSAIDVEPGQFVLAAEPVGTMSSAPRTAQLNAGSSSKKDTQASVNLPVLYIEFRKDGRPTDPDPWWVKAN